MITLTTTGTLGTISIADLGGRDFIHPTLDYDLTSEYSLEDLRDSEDLGYLLDNGDLDLKINNVSIPDSDSLRTVEAVVSSSDLGNNGGSSTTGAVLFDKLFEITLTGNVNYLDVPNIKDYNKIEVSSTKKVDIKGLKSDGVPNGFTIAIHNVSSHEHKYKKNQNAAPSTYRFDSDDVNLKKKKFIFWTWNSNDLRWNAQNDK